MINYFIKKKEWIKWFHVDIFLIEYISTWCIKNVLYFQVCFLNTLAFSSYFDVKKIPLIMEKN